MVALQAVGSSDHTRATLRRERCKRAPMVGGGSLASVVTPLALRDAAGGTRLAGWGCGDAAEAVSAATFAWGSGELPSPPPLLSSFSSGVPSMFQSVQLQQLTICRTRAAPVAACDAAGGGGFDLSPRGTPDVQAG
jgi:hypothetical protein